MVLLEAVNVSKTFRNGDQQTDVLKDINLQIRRGEFATIMGPSGSGKSTLLYAMSGLDRVTCGRVLLNGRNLAELDEDELADIRLHRIGMIFQHMHMMRSLTLQDNIVLSAFLARKRNRKSILQKAADLMKLTGIAHLADRDITRVSGGQLQRAAICRALMNDPDILFGDEPTGALNSQAAHDIMQLLADIHRQGMTILLVTHDPRVAAWSERVLFMLDGRLAAEIRLGIPAGDSAEERKERENRLTDWLKAQRF
jgi:putative ABC transport system ATP-binding protein